MVTQSPSEFVDAYTVTPRLQVGTVTALHAVRTGRAVEAAKLIRMRQRVMVPSAEIAAQVLLELGVAEFEAGWRARPPRLAQDCVDHSSLADALNEVPAHDEATELHGTGPDTLLHDDCPPLLAAPFPRAKRLKKHHCYAKDLKDQAITGGVTTLIDPRKLSATQPSVTNPGIRFYLDDPYPTKGDTYQGDCDPGNRLPLIYVREGQEALILAGHHRATVALLRGEMLEAIVANGPWGPRRGF